MSNGDHSSNVYSQNDLDAKLVGMMDALVKQLTFTNDALVQLVVELSALGKRNTLPAADTATQWSPTIPPKHIEEDGSNALGNEL